jgi:hypothetical protein
VSAPLSALPNIIKTPAGAAASASSFLTLLVYTILPPVWPWLGHQSPGWKGAVVAVLGYGCSYLASWYKVMRAHGQKLTLELTKGPLPTVQAVASPADPVG